MKLWFREEYHSTLLQVASETEIGELASNRASILVEMNTQFNILHCASKYMYFNLCALHYTLYILSVYVKCMLTETCLTFMYSMNASLSESRSFYLSQRVLLVSVAHSRGRSMQSHMVCLSYAPQAL